MLGRKQSLKGEPVLADYGPEESLNENADIEWVNKVCVLCLSYVVIVEKNIHIPCGCSDFCAIRSVQIAAKLRRQHSLTFNSLVTDIFFCSVEVCGSARNVYGLVILTS